MKSFFVSLLLIAAAVLSAAPSSQDNTLVVPSLRGLVFVSSQASFHKAGVITDGISVAGVPMLNRIDFSEQLVPYIGRPISIKQLNEITSKVSEFFKQQRHPLVDVVAPEQDVSSGVIQIVVTEFRVGDVRVQGNRWFSDSVVSAPISLKHGDAIDTEKLLNEMNAANANSFRRVDLVYKPSSQPGFTDLVLETHDRFPVTAYSGFDNSGTAVTGRSRWNMGATWGNAFQHDQQLSYQLSASDNFFTRSGPTGFLSNSLNWSMPVRSTDVFSIFGSYVLSSPFIGTDFGLVGKSGQASIRYNLGLRRTARFIHTLQAGYDFKTTNNNLAFGGTQVSRNTTEINQFLIAYAGNLTDHWGANSFTSSLVFSPGGLTPNNNTLAFQPGLQQTGIPGARAHYFYWRTDLNRLTKLPGKTVYSFRLVGQISSENLLYTEKLTGGGPDLMRGYDPNSVAGDSGFLMSNEFRSPAWKLFPERGLGEAQLFVFWDYGHLVAAHAIEGAINSTNASSVGTGLRYELRSNLTAHISYGRALVDLPTMNYLSRNSFIDLALTLAY